MRRADKGVIAIEGGLELTYESDATFWSDSSTLLELDGDCAIRWHCPSDG